MARIRLKYGSGALELDVADERLAGHWTLPRAETASGGDEPLAVAARELGAAGLVDAARGRRVGLLLPDGTRAWEPGRILPALTPLLEGAREVRAFLCTGTHTPDTPDNLAVAGDVTARLAALGPPARLVVHDARAHEHRRFGHTARGTRVEVLVGADECEVFLVFSDMRPHYFAGYSNATKCYVPGLATTDSARDNHSLALEPESVWGRHPWHPDPARRTNPLAEDLVEAFDLFVGARPHFVLALFSSDGMPLWGAGGPTREVSSRGMRVADDLGCLRLAPVRYLVVSPGGAPHDESLYQVQRALELSRDAVLDGGEVLLLAECANGIGPPGSRERFFDPLTRPLDEITAPSRDEYTLYAHKPFKMARLLGRLDAVHFHGALDDADVRAIHMRPAARPQDVLDAWQREAAPGDRIGFLDDASKVAVIGA